MLYPHMQLKHVGPRSHCCFRRQALTLAMVCCTMIIAACALRDDKAGKEEGMQRR